MNSGRFVLTQILDLVHWQTLSRLVSKYNAESKVKIFIWRCKCHYIFYLERGEFVDVLAILHTSRDLVMHLNDRLGDC